MKQNKFEIGDIVKEIGQPDSEGGVVTKLKYDSDLGFSYIFATKEVDHVKKEVIDGFKVCTEKELEVISVK